jgi:hypothetical protein
MNNTEYYTEYEVCDLVDNIGKLTEYLYGWDDAIVDGTYKKRYVDMYRNR